MLEHLWDVLTLSEGVKGRFCTGFVVWIFLQSVSGAFLKVYACSCSYLCFGIVSLILSLSVLIWTVACCG